MSMRLRSRPATETRPGGETFRAIVGEFVRQFHDSTYFAGLELADGSNAAGNRCLRSRATVAAAMVDSAGMTAA